MFVVGLIVGMFVAFAFVAALIYWSDEFGKVAQTAIDWMNRG